MLHHILRSTPVRGALAVLALAAAATPAEAQRRLLGTPVVQARALASSSAGLASSRGGESAGLLVPVEGVRPEELRDSYTHARSQGRTHHAIDIHAPEGTPVLAVANATVLKLHQGARGGIAAYLLDEDGRTRYYYAHLDDYAEGLHEGQRVERGEVIGFVGDTGNAAPGDHHLHFSIAILDDPDRWWQGRNLNPYELLRQSR